MAMNPTQEDLFFYDEEDEQSTYSDYDMDSNTDSENESSSSYSMTDNEDHITREELQRQIIETENENRTLETVLEIYQQLTDLIDYQNTIYQNIGSVSLQESVQNIIEFLIQLHNVIEKSSHSEQNIAIIYNLIDSANDFGQNIISALEEHSIGENIIINDLSVAITELLQNIIASSDMNITNESIRKLIDALRALENRY